MSDEHQENSDPHIPTDVFDCIQLTFHPNNITAKIEYTTKDGPNGFIKYITLRPPGPSQSEFDHLVTRLLDHFREQIREKIECDRNNPATPE